MCFGELADFSPVKLLRTFPNLNAKMILKKADDVWTRLSHSHSLLDSILHHLTDAIVLQTWNRPLQVDAQCIKTNVTDTMENDHDEEEFSGEEWN